MKKLVSLVIVHWNNSKNLKTLLRTIGKHNEFEITVVDNNSIDKPIWIRKQYPYVRLILNKNNFGYAIACNIGAENAKGDWLLFLNDDIVLKKLQISDMIEYLQNNHFSVGSPITSNNAYRKPIPTPLSLITEFTPLKYLIPLKIFKNKTLFGGCVLIKRSVFEQLDGWSQDFFLWFEDSDLTKRLNDLGFIIGWVPIHIDHIGGLSFKKLDEYKKRVIFFNSMDIYAQKHFSLIGKFVVNLLKYRYTRKSV